MIAAYLPHHLATVAVVFMIGCLVFACGRLTTLRQPSAWGPGWAWLFAIAGVWLVERIAATEQPGVRMVSIIASLFWSMKWIVLSSDRQMRGTELPASRWLAFLYAWPGMQPAIFNKPLSPDINQAWRIGSRGLVRCLIGIGFIVIARSLISANDSLPYGSMRSTAATWLLMVGISLFLHFGIINLVAAGWQLVGINCQPVFRAPLQSATLSEFWSRRWNLAFSEMTAIAIYRPLEKRWGPTAALLIGFVFSGVVHELAITVTVQSGYGGPLGYFVLHGLLVELERRLQLPRRLGAVYRLWVAVAVLAPLPWLFPAKFLSEIVWPLARW